MYEGKTVENGARGLDGGWFLNFGIPSRGNHTTIPHRQIREGKAGEKSRFKWKIP